MGIIASTLEYARPLRARTNAKRSGAPSADWRIAVLGAGAAGLSIAHALEHAGYRHVTVLERSDRVGGKCCTIDLEGRSYELGAALLTPAYQHVRALAREVGARVTPKISGICLDLETGRKTFRVPAVRDASTLDLGIALARLCAELVHHRRVLHPGFSAVDPKLARPFTEWAGSRGLMTAARLMEPWFTTFGYGYVDEMPAAYVLKYAALFGPAFELLDGGYQGLWERVARRLDVRRNVDVRAVRRDDDGVAIEWNGRTTRFDALIVACPVDAALAVLDAGTEERDLLSRVRWQDYRVVVASVKRFCDGRYVFFPKHFASSTRGHPMFTYRRWADSDVRLFYAFGAGDTSLDETAERVAETVRAAGGELTRVHRTVGWRYFPHVTPADMAAGFYDRLEALQGERRTFHAGELLSFGTVENVVAYSNTLVQRGFGAPRLGIAPSAWA